MELKRFKIVSPRDVQSTDNNFETMLINLNHIISIKPIRMVLEEKVVEGYWIRTSNGKKYRAIEIPKELKIILNDESISHALNGVAGAELSESQFLN
jgi:hypothetical protein